jgi:hypothetical protein
MPLVHRSPPCFQKLQSLAPDALDQLFLTVCIGNAIRIHEAWAHWMSARVDLPSLLRARPRRRRLLPLFHWSLMQNGISADEKMAAILRAAWLWEEKRAAVVRQVLAAALISLDRAGVPVALLKGAALAETVYTHHALRHCHDIDLLVEETRLSDAQAALTACGFKSKKASQPHHIAVTHPDGLPITLHTRLWDNSARPGNFQSLSPYFISATTFGGPALVLPRMMMLLQVCTHSGIWQEPGDLTWMADAAAIFGRGAPNQDELTALCAYAGAHGMALALAIRLYILVQMGVAVPPGLTETLLLAMKQNFQSEYESVFDMASRCTRLPRWFFIRQTDYRIGWRAVIWAIRRRMRASWSWQ